MTSTSFMTGTGLKKCMPMTCSGRWVWAASLVMEMDEVLEARMTSGGRVWSRCGRWRSLISKCSVAASMAKSAAGEAWPVDGWRDAGNRARRPGAELACPWLLRGRGSRGWWRLHARGNAVRLRTAGHRSRCVQRRVRCRCPSCRRQARRQWRYRSFCSPLFLKSAKQVSVSVIAREVWELSEDLSFCRSAGLCEVPTTSEPQPRSHYRGRRRPWRFRSGWRRVHRGRRHGRLFPGCARRRPLLSGRRNTAG